jgi:hypothetical protein
MTATRVIHAFSVLVLLPPWLCGQNPDELLVVRLPAKHGHINEPGAPPIPFIVNSQNERHGSLLAANLLANH